MVFIFKRLNYIIRTQFITKNLNKEKEEKLITDRRNLIKRSRRHRYVFNRNKFNFNRFMNKFITHLFKFFCRKLKYRYKIKVRRFNLRTYQNKLYLNKFLNPLFIKIISSFLIFSKIHYLKQTLQSNYFFSNNKHLYYI
jgi:hypothetical protein